VSLFIEEEVCSRCTHAVFHQCCEKFCYCLLGEEPDLVKGKCEYYAPLYDIKAEKSLKEGTNED